MAPTRVQRPTEANRFVSRRLRDLRVERGLSQRAAGQLLERFVGGRWPVQAVSRAELCAGEYIKRWNVDDVCALAAAFEVPVSEFFAIFEGPRPQADAAPAAHNSFG